jgi:ketosteroid isomerase-like protein
MTRAVYLLLLVAICCSCKEFRFEKDKERIEALNQMQQTDIDFSNRSKEAGMKKAFLEYIQEEGVLLRPHRMPITGAAAIDYLSSINDSSLILTWTPQGGNVSKSADMGYTYGVYTLAINDSAYKGTYVTIWQKQADGTWKFVLDTGNEGVGK